MALLWLWSHGARVYWDDFIADRGTEAFFKQCTQNGTLTTEERADLGLGKTTTGHSKPIRLIHYADFIRAICEDMAWPEEDARRCMALRLEEENILSQHVEYYLNYPAWTVQDLAKAFNVDPAIVKTGLRRVRRTWPALRLDGTRAYGVPHLNRMRRLYAENRSDGHEFDLLDCSAVIPICGGFSAEPVSEESLR
jgi:hypothetical protein